MSTAVASITALLPPHLHARVERAQNGRWDIRELRPGCFGVTNLNNGGHRYTVTYHPSGWTCTCPDFQNRQGPCKHMIAVWLHGPVIAVADDGEGFLTGQSCASRIIPISLFGAGDGGRSEAPSDINRRMKMFQKAQKSQSKARIALIGPSGCGKTYTALLVASGLGQRVAVIDTENASASKYADQFEFDVVALDQFSPQAYIAAIKAAEEEGYDVLIIDSLSHAWAGKDGVLAMVDQAAKRYNNNSFVAWRDVTPEHNRLVDALVHCKCHLIVTMRAKTHYDAQKDKDGKVVPVKVGLEPIQRDGVEYEFDIVADMDLQHNLIVTKTRCRALDGAVINRPGAELGATIRNWLSDGESSPGPGSRQAKNEGDGNDNGKATPAQIQQIVALLSKLGYTTQQSQDEALTRRGYPPIELMDSIQALDVIARLEARAQAVSVA